MVNQQTQNNSTDSFDSWDKLKYLFSNPKLFFEKIKSENGIKNAFLIFTIVVFFVSIVQFGFSLLPTYFMHYRTSFLVYGFFSLFGGAFVIFGFILSLIMSFLYSGIVHLLVVGFKGKGSFSDTYKAYAYSMLPFQILILIPFIGFLSIIYSFILMIIGVSKLHNLSKGKAALACLLPAIFIVGSLIILIVFYIGYFLRGHPIGV